MIFYIMNIFIDTISNPAFIFLFNSNREIIDKITWEVRWNESSTLIPKIDELLEKNKLDYWDLDNLVVVNGPWSFTWIRTTILAINTINYIIDKNITALSYFDLFNNYPIIKSSSKRDAFVKYDKDTYIEIIENDKLLEILSNKNITTVYGEINPDVFENIKIIDKIDYISIIKNIKLDKAKQIQALYIKKPNIS